MNFRNQQFMPKEKLKDLKPQLLSQMTVTGVVSTVLSFTLLTQMLSVSPTHDLYNIGALGFAAVAAKLFYFDYKYVREL